MNSYIFIVCIAVLSHVNDSEEIQKHGRYVPLQRDRSNKEELIQIVERLNNDDRRKNEEASENVMEEVSQFNPDYVSKSDAPHGNKESRVHYIANPAVLHEYMERLNNYGSDLADLSQNTARSKEVSRRNARFRLGGPLSNEIKQDLNKERNKDNTKLSTYMMAPSIQPLKYYNNNGERERTDHVEENNYNIEVKERNQNNHMNPMNGNKYQWENSNANSQRVDVEILHTKKDDNKRKKNYGEDDSPRQIKSKTKEWIVRNDRNKKKDWNDTEKKIDWYDYDKKIDWENSAKKNDWDNDREWSEKGTSKKSNWHVNEKDSLAKSTTKRIDSSEVWHKKKYDENNWNKKNNNFNGNKDRKKEHANKNEWDTVGIDYYNPTTRNKKRLSNNYDRIDISKQYARTSKKPGWREDAVEQLKKMERQNNDWDKITNSWDQNMESNVETKKNTWKKRKDWKLIPTFRDISLITKRTTRRLKTKLKNIGNWDQPLPNFENRYKHKIADYYRPNRDKEYRNGNSQAFGRTPIPFVGKKGIYAEK